MNQSVLMFMLSPQKMFLEKHTRFHFLLNLFIKYLIEINRNTVAWIKIWHKNGVVRNQKVFNLTVAENPSTNKTKFGTTFSS